MEQPKFWTVTRAALVINLALCCLQASADSITPEQDRSSDLPAAPKTSEDVVSSFVFNPTHKKCEQISGSCHGNTNCFPDLATCEATCAGQSPAQLLCSKQLQYRIKSRRERMANADLILFPYGPGTSDLRLPQTLDGSSNQTNLTTEFPFFDNVYDILFVNNNGHITFNRPFSRFNPEFPILGSNIAMIAPFWADSDTTANGSGYVWYRETDEEELVVAVKARIEQAYPFTAQDFVPRHIIIATWDHIGYYPRQTDKLNTYQCVLATDGDRSYALFLYEDIQWTTSSDSGGVGGLGGNPAIVGFNAGDGVRSVEIPDSNTNEIVNIETTSNIGVPGLWVFRVDEQEIVPIRDCTINISLSASGTENLQIQPNYGNMLGGALILVTGAGCLSEDDGEIRCVFGNASTTGKLLQSSNSSAQLVLCNAPRLPTGVTMFQLMVGDSVKGSARYHSLPLEHSHAVHVGRTDSLLLTSKTGLFPISWKSKDVFPNLLLSKIGEPEVQFDFLFYDKEDWKEDVVNVNIQTIEMTQTAEQSTSSVFPKANAMGAARPGEPTSTLTPVIIRIILTGMLSLEADNISTIRYSVTIWSGIYFYLNFLGKGGQDSDKFFNGELSKICLASNENENVQSDLPPCPRTSFQALIDSRYSEDSVSSLVSADESYEMAHRNFFHGSLAEMCYRSQSTNQGTWNQCCYDKGGNLITLTEDITKSIGGTVQLASDTTNHFNKDVLPFIACCKSDDIKLCEKNYLNDHKQDNGSTYRLQVPGCIYGDPHVVTSDGLKYTFNGKGEFTLVETDDDSFTLQGRMEDSLSNTSGDSVPATVFSALVCKQNDSDTVQFQLSRRGIDTLVNGEIIDLTSIPQRDFDGVTVLRISNSSVSALFTSNAYLEVKEDSGIITLVLVSLPPTLLNRTRGLLGRYNGDTSDDLVSRNGTISLSGNESLQTIHEDFGITWIIREANNSLFTYAPGESWSTFYDPGFVPVFEPIFFDPALEQEAVAICGNDSFCLFDIAATGNMDIGLSTLDGSLNYETIVEMADPVCEPPCGNGFCILNNTCSCHSTYEGPLCTVPILCDPPCVNGLCVANATCDCDEDFEGTTCSIQKFKRCEINVCQNGGKCSQHRGVFSCDCPAKYSGLLCHLRLDTLQNGSNQTDVCALEADPGPVSCDMEVSSDTVERTFSFFFNKVSGECERFNYNGCQGNQNRFTSKRQCRMSCNLCGLPAEPGSCAGLFPSFYFNPASMRCELFIYGGCEGNANQFPDQASCEVSCGGGVCPPTCSKLYCEHHENALCTNPGPSEASSCAGPCQLTYCGACYFSNNTLTTPNVESCLPQRCHGNTPFGEDNRCFYLWSICVYRAHRLLHGPPSDKEQRNFKCYSPCPAS